MPGEKSIMSRLIPIATSRHPSPSDKDARLDGEAAEDRPIAEDDSCPVDVESDVDYATPPDWNWKLTGASKSSKATYYVNQSEITRVLVDVLRPSDSPPDAPFVLSREIPIVIIDSLDKYWVGESRHQLPLHGLRVPVAQETVEGAKQALAADLAAQLRLLLLLSTSYKERMAPQLKANLERLGSILTANPELQKGSGF